MDESPNTNQYSQRDINNVVGIQVINNIVENKDSNIKINEIRNVFVEYYKINFEYIERIKNSPMLMDDCMFNLKEIDKFFKDDEIISRKNVKNNGDFNTFNFINIEDLIKLGQSLLIVGDAGTGKTILMKYICYKWSQKKIWRNKVGLTIYIPLKKWKQDCKQSIPKFIYNYYFNEYSEEEYRGICRYIQNNGDKILTIFDGYDELGDYEKQEFKDINSKFNCKYKVYTSRVYDTPILRFEKKIENIGFTYKNIIEYIEIYFNNDQIKKMNILKYIERNLNILTFIRIPLLLELMCIIWENDKENESNYDITITEIYTKSIDKIFHEYACIKGEPIIRNEWESICDSLGFIAYKSLEMNERIIKGETLESLLNEYQKNNIHLNLETAINKDVFIKTRLLKSGLFKVYKESADILRCDYTFIHSTFQEYLVAYYISKRDEDQYTELFNMYINDSEKELVLIFLSGIISSNKNKLTLLIDSLMNKVEYSLGFYYHCMLVSCLGQVKTEKIDERISSQLDRLTFHLINENNQFAIRKISQYIKFNKTYINELIEKCSELFLSDFFVPLGYIILLSELRYTNEVIEDNLLKFLNDEGELLIKDYFIEIVDLIYLKQEKLYNILIEHIDDEDIGHYFIIQALVKLCKNNKEFITELCKEVNRSDYYYKRYNILLVLKNFINDEITALFYELLDDKDDWIRKLSLNVLCDIHKENINYIYKNKNLINDKDEVVRANSVEKIYKWYRESKDCLNYGTYVELKEIAKEAEKDESDLVRVRAAELLNILGYPKDRSLKIIIEVLFKRPSNFKEKIKLVEVREIAVMILCNICKENEELYIILSNILEKNQMKSIQVLLLKGILINNIYDVNIIKIVEDLLLKSDDEKLNTYYSVFLIKQGRIGEKIIENILNGIEYLEQVGSNDDYIIFNDILNMLGNKILEVAKIKNIFLERVKNSNFQNKYIDLITKYGNQEILITNYQLLKKHISNIFTKINLDKCIEFYSSDEDYVLDCFINKIIIEAIPVWIEGTSVCFYFDNIIKRIELKENFDKIISYVKGYQNKIIEEI